MDAGQALQQFVRLLQTVGFDDLFDITVKGFNLPGQKRHVPHRMPDQRAVRGAHLMPFQSRRKLSNLFTGAALRLLRNIGAAE